MQALQFLPVFTEFSSELVIVRSQVRLLVRNNRIFSEFSRINIPTRTRKFLSSTLGCKYSYFFPSLFEKTSENHMTNALMRSKVHGKILISYDL